MLLVISPAKTLDYQTQTPTSVHTIPETIDASAELIDQLKDFSPAQLASLMGISDKLADLNVARYLAWQTDFTLDNSRQAIFAFKGDVYTGLDAYSLSQSSLEFAQSHLRILSGLYGILRPLDLMQPYRLEMGIKLENARGKNLYDFWRQTIAPQLKLQMERVGSDTLLNLASNEYFSSVDTKALGANVVSPVFKDFKNGKYKIISFYAKKARGTMTRWIVENQITHPERLVEFDQDGYTYSEQGSTPSAPLFLRD